VTQEAVFDCVMVFLMALVVGLIGVLGYVVWRAFWRGE
jgi:hypothetical protein